MIGIDAILKIGEKVLDRVLPDPAAKAEAQAKLMELAQKGDLANLQAEVDFARIDAEDRDSARSRESEMAKADVWDLTKNINTVLAIGVIALSFILFAALMTIEVKSMAKAEGWVDKSGSKWKTMPELMMRYRAAAFFGRLYAPEITMGMHSVEEIVDIQHEEPNAVAEINKMISPKG